MVAAPLRAHHAFAAEFDANKQVTLRGTLTKMEWINPHSWIHIDVKDSAGKVANWAIECGAPNTLIRRGLNKTSIPAGTDIVASVFPADEFAAVQKGNVNDPKAAELYGIQARNLKKLSDQGTRIVLGTDGNTPWGPHDEMLDMVSAGMTPMQVIVASTRNSAEFLRLNDTGTLQAGKSADFIVLDANPLDDITNTRRISQVVLRGAQVDRSQPVR